MNAILRNVMDLKTLLDTPPWDWPTDAGRMFRKILIDQRAESDRLVAAELAGDFTARRLSAGHLGPPTATDSNREMRKEEALTNSGQISGGRRFGSSGRTSNYNPSVNSRDHCRSN